MQGIIGKSQISGQIQLFGDEKITGAKVEENLSIRDDIHIPICVQINRQETV